MDERLIGNECRAGSIGGTLVELFRSTVNNCIGRAKDDTYFSPEATKILKNIVSIHEPAQQSLFMSRHGHKIAFVVDKRCFSVAYRSIRVVQPILDV